MACPLPALQALHSADSQNSSSAHTGLLHTVYSNKCSQLQAALKPAASQHPLERSEQRDMANKRNQAKKAKKAARDADFVAAHAHKIDAIRKNKPQK